MNLRGIILGITIFVLTLFVTTYGTDMFYSKPLYKDFCKNAMKMQPVDEITCLNEGGKWQIYDVPKIEDERGYCEMDFTCRKDYESTSEKYSLNIFLIALPLGILIVLAGAYFFSLDAVGVGLMAGGVGTILRGVSSFWRYSADWLRFLFSLIGLVIVIYFSYRFGEKLGFETSKKKK